MKLSKPFLLIFFWCVMALTGLWVPMACTNTKSNYLPTYPDITVVASATATNQYGYTSTATYTLQPTFTVTNTPTPAATMQNPSNLYSPQVPNGLAVVAGSPISIYVAGGDGNLTIFGGASPVTINQYSLTGASFSSLSSVAVDTNNNVYYVLDQGNDAVYEFATGSNTPVTTWNHWGSGVTFNQPGGVAVDSGGNVYIADTGNDQIDVFSSNGISSTYQWGVLGNGNGNFDNPSAVVVNSAATTVYVADASNHLIQTFGPTGNWLSQFPTVANSDVFGITLDGAGNLYAADYNTADPMVEEYQLPSGTITTVPLTAQWNGPGGVGSSFGPDGVSWSGSLLYVADYDNNAIDGLTP